jgi:threonine synthase
MRRAGMLSRSTRRLVSSPLQMHARCMATTRYRSTRGGQTGLKFDETVLQGLGRDRGLMVPEDIPSFPAGAPECWRGLKFEELAYEVMSLYIGPDDIPAANLKDIINRSYATFRDEDVTPVVPISDGLHTLELFHGPTFAFKDVALQFLGNLFEYLLAQRPGASITVLGATSGDTGSSAIHGLRGKAGVECFIMYPEGRTSRTQELQMISVTDPNIHNISLRGTFDDCQAIVKACFNDPEFRDTHNLAAVNSINWARILAQMVYYVHAYLKVTTPPAAGAAPQKVSFSVPTGNFGDILAGYYAKRMGLPGETPPLELGHTCHTCRPLRGPSRPFEALRGPSRLFEAPRQPRGAHAHPPFRCSRGAPVPDPRRPVTRDPATPAPSRTQLTS